MKPTKKVMLAPNTQVPFNSKYIRYPMLASEKLDGIYFIIHQGGIFSRALKYFRNRYIEQYFAPAITLAKEKKLIITGELAGDLPVNEVQRAISTFAPNIDLVKKLQLKAFDCVKEDAWYGRICHETFDKRLQDLFEFEEELQNRAIFEVIEQGYVNTPEEAEEYYNKIVMAGGEGIILKRPNSYYFHNRTSIASGIMFKFKHTYTAEAIIKEILPAREMLDDVPRERRADGVLEPVHKQQYFTNGNIAGAVILEDLDGTVFKAGFGKKFTKDIKQELLLNRNKYIGKVAEYVAMPTLKDKPRAPKLVRIREDI